jgi:hypothetical protein
VQNRIVTYHLLTIFYFNFNLFSEAKTYTSLIILEKDKKVHEKKIQPTKTVGLAGGEKYIVNGIVLKFALDVQKRDDKWIFGGNSRNDGYASKSAGQELLSSDFLGLFSLLFISLIIKSFLTYLFRFLFP